MNTKIASLVAASLAALATPAVAQSAGEAPFSGLRVGGEVGYDNIRSGSTEDVDDTRDLKQSIDGVTYGGVVGYDVAASDTLRIGAEASYAGSSAGRDFNNERPTVFNLGYTEEVAVHYPWVKEQSGGIASGHPRRRGISTSAD